MQTVYIEALKESYSFDAWEAIHTEVSQKYSMKMIEAYVVESGFEICEGILPIRINTLLIRYGKNYRGLNCSKA